MSDHFFRSLKIENFRGIQSLEINDLARVNLFVGMNNTGKTTVLESIFLLTGISNPRLMVSINAFRGLKVTSSKVFGDYFYASASPELRFSSLTDTKQERRLAIAPLYSDQLPQVIDHDPTPENSLVEGSPKNFNVISNAPRNLVGLRCEVKILESNGRTLNDFQTAVAFNEVGQSIVKQPTREKYIETVSGVLNSPTTGYNSEFVDQMLNNKKKEVLLRALRIIEESVEDIRVGADGYVYIDIGRPSFIPINLAGDGMITILQLITGVVSASSGICNGIYVVDEIESGLHISAVRDIWKMLLNQSKEHGTQIFATTHSKDIVEALQEMMANNEIEEGEIAIYLLDKTPKAGVKAYKKSTKQLVRAWEVGSDVRL